MRARSILVAGLGLLIVLPAAAQDRDTKVRNDRATFQTLPGWVYNDLDEGLRMARVLNKPLLAVVRCIPCEACHAFDDDVARRDPAVRDLMDRFVCIRIVQANQLDLKLFDYDFDQSFAIVFLNADKTVYGRFGTRSDRPESEDISLAGLRAAMEAVLTLHQAYPANRAALANKQPKSGEFRTPLDYPKLAARFGPALDYEGKVAQSCMHCHQVREAQRLTFRDAGRPIPDEVLFPNPDPSVIGLTMDPATVATISKVETGSIADAAGLKPGDSITTLAGQPLISTADLQWVLHTTPNREAELVAEAERAGSKETVTLNLPKDWRRRGDLSWRVSTWDLRRLALGGLVLADLGDDRRGQAGLPKDGLALEVKHVGEYGEHAIAKKAGFLKGDIIVEFDGRSDRMRETDLLAAILRDRPAGRTVTAKILRDGVARTLTYRLQ